MARKARILIVDDEKYIRDLLEKILTDAGYECVKASNGAEALETLKKENFDILITGIRTPGVSGINLIKKAMRIKPYIAIIVILAAMDIDVAVKALKSGAYDYVIKPINDLNRLLHTIHQTLELRKLKLENIRYQQHLEKMVQQRARHIQKLFFNSTTALVHALEEKDGYTKGHSKRVAEISCTIGRIIGMSERQITQLDLAGQLHDIGKIGIPDSILQKPGPLLPEEYEIVKSHPFRSYRILKPLFEFKSSLDEITMNKNGKAREETLDIILHHHERFDGKGYPNGLKGEEIPLGARILAVADAYEAMTSSRPYRMVPLSHDKAVTEIQKNSGTQFDPEMVEIFLKMFKG